MFKDFLHKASDTVFSWGKPAAPAPKPVLRAMNNQALAQSSLIRQESQARVMATPPQDRYESAFATATPTRGATSSLKVLDAQGKAKDAAQFLDSYELFQIQRLPVYYQNRVLKVPAAHNRDQVRQHIQANLQNTIQEMVGTARIRFAEKDGRKWGVQNLADLANAMNHLPIAHRKQLDGVTFVRDDYPQENIPQGGNMIERIAAKQIAGHYDLKSKSVILYDRALQDSFPTLDAEARQGLAAVRQKSPGEVQALQTMLNPYLVGLDQTPLKPDGLWGPNTERAVRTVQSELLKAHIESQYTLNPTQKQALDKIVSLARSPQFEMLSRMVNVSDQLKELQLLPEPHMQQLLQEMSKSEFGEASLQFLLQDVSDVFRSNRQVARTEEILVHEMGHHFQLGLSNENHYISEFSKLSGWVETSGGEVADGYSRSVYTPENLMDVYAQLASRGAIDEGNYVREAVPGRNTDNFVTRYAATDPMEDFAETYKTFILNPQQLLKVAPEKFLFLNSLPMIQSRKMGSGSQEKSHYLPADVKFLATAALRSELKKEPTQQQVNAFLGQAFDSMLGVQAQGQFRLGSDTILSIVDTHRPLMESIGMAYIPTDKTFRAGDSESQVLQQIHNHTLALMHSGGMDREARQFFNSFKNSGQLEALFPKASPELKESLKDPAFSSMMLALGKMGGYALAINQAKREDFADQAEFRQAQDYFSKVAESPSNLLSKQVFAQSFNYVRGLGSNVYNPEAKQVDQALRFFQVLQNNPERAFPDQWASFPDEFKQMLGNERFVAAVSGDGGRYVPAPEVTRSTLQKIMEMVEFQRGIDMLRD